MSEVLSIAMLSSVVTFSNPPLGLLIYGHKPRNVVIKANPILRWASRSCTIFLNWRCESLSAEGYGCRVINRWPGGLDQASRQMQPDS